MTRAAQLQALSDNDVVVADARSAPKVLRPEFAPEHVLSADLSIHTDLSAVEDEWRRFERNADCTAFQSFDWLSTWQRHIGRRQGITPVIAVGRYAGGETAFILPLAVEPRMSGRRLCWLGQNLCDYTGPLLARDFAACVSRDRFLQMWRDGLALIRRDPRTRYDWIELEKMPYRVGRQANPFTYLDVALNPSGAHFTRLGDSWEKFYFDKRSSATRRHDRTKRRRLAAFGEVRFASCTDVDDARRTTETLMRQKSRALTRRGISDVFARAGCREFFLDLATNPNTRHLVHISRIEVGTVWAALNLGIVFGDCYYHVVASYEDCELARFGPGALHLRELMAHAIGRGLKRFDFTIGDERYKLEWSDSHLKLCNHVAAATWRGRPASAWAKARNSIKRFIKQTPAVWRMVNAARSAIGSLRALPR